MKEKVKCLLAKVCEEKKTTIYDLAKKMGYHPNKFYAYVAGSYTPNVGLVLKMAKHLKCNVEDLFKL
jgi:DNA-binding XRE family transcriptional regulator